MYSFVDTVENAGTALIPAEAMKINGEYIENQISGYRTLYVKGREALSPELTTYETGIRDGATLLNKRYPARIITIGYQLIASTSQEFREAYNRLNAVLNVEGAELIFNDEPDKYFTGTPTEIGSVEPGRNAVTGEFEILCTDPFKYSVAEYEAEPTVDDGFAFVIDYNGTYKSYPTLEADFYIENETGSDGEAEEELTGNGDCGYVAFFNEDGKIIQLGDPDEEDTESYAKSQTLISQSFVKIKAWTAALNALWLKNQGIVAGSTVQAGSPGFAHSYSTTDENTYYLKASGYGTDTYSYYHGPSVTRKVPADASGHIGAADFTFKYKQKMCIGNGKNANLQCGSFQALLVSGSGTDRKIVAGVYIYKSGSGNKANLKLYVNHKSVYTRKIDLSYYNVYFGTSRAANKAKGIKAVNPARNSSIVKSGEKVTFNIAGIKKTFRDSEIADMEVQEITFVFTRYKTKTALAYNGIYSTSFVKNNCDTWRDIPNKFTSNDVVVADCRTGDVILNDLPSPELGAVGNDWEEFYLKPGQNQIGVSYSEWVTDEYAPQFKVRYREVFL